MARKLMILVLIAFLSGPLFAQATNDGTSTGDPAADKEKEDKKADKYLGIDWGDTKTAEKTDDPDAKQPSTKVDLTTALDEPQKKRLEVIQKAAAKGDELATKAAQAYSGEDKRAKKTDAIVRYENAGKIFLKASVDIENLAKGIKDEDTRLTLLREQRDPMKAKACEMFCKAANIIIEEAKTPADLKKISGPLQLARQADKDNPAIAATIEAARKAYTDMMTKLQEAAASQQSSSGKEDEEEKPYDNGRTTIDPGSTGRDYKKHY